MSTMTMDMSDYTVTSDSPAAVEYTDEILNAGWNPELALQRYAVSEHHEMPCGLVLDDVSAFLHRMYASQR